MKKYDADMLMHYIAIAKEIAEATLGALLLFGGIIAVWFLACALA